MKLLNALLILLALTIGALADDAVKLDKVNDYDFNLTSTHVVKLNLKSLNNKKTEIEDQIEKLQSNLDSVNALITQAKAAGVIEKPVSTPKVKVNP